MREAAGKTGTSDKTRDAWFVGFTPNLVAGVWVGLDDNSPLGLTGGGASAPIWAEFMKCSAPFIENVKFLQPRGVSVVEVDSESGELATSDCPEGQRVKEVYVTGTEPVRRCHLHDLSQGGTTVREPRLPEPEEHRRPPRQRSFWDSIFG
jgi:membrane carboxypeptidase/penicillin-binding protein